MSLESVVARKEAHWGEKVEGIKNLKDYRKWLIFVIIILFWL